MNTFQNIIIRNPEIMAGKPIIKGTRITVEIILKKLSEGISIENLLEIYPQLTNNQVFASLEYASNIIANEDLLEVS
ncbi:MAG TPA: antitoxin [Flavobacterium sp.]|nr:antitoxin [Flavobacterium sp.]